jgi:hypothetical protein
MSTVAHRSGAPAETFDLVHACLVITAWGRKPA